MQDNNSVSGSAYKDLSEWKYLTERQKWVAKWIKDYYILVIITIIKCDVSKKKWVLLRGS